MSSRRQTYGDGTVRRSSRSDQGSQRAPIWVLARSYTELQEYCRRYQKPIKSYKFIDGPHRIRQEIPIGSRWRLVRTGTWFLMDKDVLAEIEFEIDLRKETQG